MCADRTLLELHYDDVHIEKFRGKKKVPSRPGEYKVFQSVAQAHRKKLCQRVALPKTVKAILRCPAAALVASRSKKS